MPNTHDNALDNFLFHYATQPASPHYAVMIEGEWGSGKTWLIKDFAKRLTRQHQKKTLYVSLYGVSSVTDIAEQFYQQLHPVLGHELVRTSWSLARKALKGTFKIADEAVELEFATPDVQRRLKTHDAILIFDDLERSTMGIEDVLGIINQLVEHDDHRVLVLANADKVPASIAGIPFKTLKEKVIGRTFHIGTNSVGALAAFLEELVNMPGHHQLVRNQDTILRVFEQANYRNLRQLRQALLDFSHVWKALHPAGLVPNLPAAFVTRLTYEVIALSLEYRAAQLTLNDLDRLNDVRATLPYLGPQPLLQGHGMERLRRHGLDDVLAYALSPAMYREFFQTGQISSLAVHNLFDYSDWFLAKERAVWLHLWHWHTLSNPDFQAALENLEQDYREFKFSNPGEFLHATGLLLQFAKMNLLNMSEDVLERLGGELIQHRWAGPDAAIELLTAAENAAIDSDGAYDLPYWSRDSLVFRTVQARLRTAVANNQKQAFQHWFEPWMKELKSDPEAWASQIVPRLGQPAKYAKQPMTKHLHLAEFAKLLANGDMAMLRVVLRALQVRYGDIPNHALAAEIEFWREMQRQINFLLSDRAAPQEFTLSRAYFAQHVVPMIASIPGRLEKLAKPV